MNDQFDLLPCAYVAFDDAGSIISCNQMLVDWLGYSKEALIGGSIEKIFTLSTRIFYSTHFYPLIRLHSKATEIFLSLKTSDNKDLPVLANAKRSADPNSYIIHCVFMLVEERKKFEQELLNAKRGAEVALQENKQLIDLTKSLQEQSVELDKQYQNQKTVADNLLQFSKIISHDLQEPIRKIQIFADRMLNDENVDKKSTNIAAKIASSAAKLKTLTIGLRQYIDVDSEKLYSVVHLHEVISAAVQKASEAHQNPDFDIQLSAMPPIEGYASQLELLFFHLADNAIKFRNPDKKLILKVESLLIDENAFKFSRDRYRYVPHIRIRFTDNGLGIPDEYKNYIFQLLKKIDVSSMGLGLGLPLVKKIVDNHAGRVAITSELGSGTSCELLFPLKMTDIRGNASGLGFADTPA